MLQAKSILILEVGSKEEVRTGYTVSGENMGMLQAELKLCLSEFLTAVKDVTGKSLIINNSIKGGDVTEYSYIVEEQEGRFALCPQGGGTRFIIPKQIKEEKDMKTEEFNLEEALKGTAVPEKMISYVVGKLSERMEKEGIDLTNKERVMAYVAANAEVIRNIAKEYEEKYAFTPVPGIEGPVNDLFMKTLKENDQYNNGLIYASLFGYSFGKDEFKAYANTVFTHFKDDKKAIGDYFRKAAGVDTNAMDYVKQSVYVSADTSRAVGDAIEVAVVTTIKAINKYGFHGLATLMEKTVGGRPESIKDYNFIKDPIKKAQRERADRLAVETK
jgi:hypothetical protein